MEVQRKLLKKDSLLSLLSKIRDNGKVLYAPALESGTLNFKVITDINEVVTDYIQTAQSAKAVVFPKVEKLLEYERKEGNLVVHDVKVDTFPETVLFGVHPCDAAAFASLNSIFTWDTEDVFFTTRLKKMTVIGLSCIKADNACFCTSIGLNPGGTLGSDILITPLKSGDFLAEIITEKGLAIVNSSSGLFLEAGNEDKESELVKVEVQFDLKDINSKLDHAFEDDIWKEQSMRCLGCGACAYVCPTCACFDIQDEGNGNKGVRVRCWDSCAFSLFTLHTSGHNPREIQNQRWRQRILHKFLYMPERQQVYGCVGCGRCTRGCPVDMNILEHLKKIKEEVK